MFKRKKPIIILVIILISFSSLFIFLGRQYVPPILMYHSVNPAPNPRVAGLIVTPQVFERQVSFLKRNHYNVVSLETLAGYMRAKLKIPAKTVAITLDDGYKDNFTYAFPILKKYNLPATIFIIVGEVGRPQNDRLSWEEIKIMRGSGLISFGSHCLGAIPLTNIGSKEQLRKEIFESKKILEEKLGQEVLSFSYPEGRFNEEIKNMVIDAGYKLAVATNPGKNFPNNDLFALKRLRISSNANNLFVFWIEASGYYNFMRESKRK